MLVPRTVFLRRLAPVVLAACASARDPGGGELAPGAAPVASDPGADASTPAPSVVASVASHLRYLAINVGNVAVTCRDYEFKLCSADTSGRIHDYIATWMPDVVLVSEVLDEPQLDRVLHDSDLRAGGDPTSNLGGPILPGGYDHVCHPSVDRTTGGTSTAPPLDDAAASHRHECVAWRRDRLALVSEAHVFGANTPELRPKCNYDFTAQAATLALLGTDDGNGKPIEVTGIAPHPSSDSEDVACRKDIIERMWRELTQGPRVFLGGDFNTDVGAELQVPAGMQIHYSDGFHFATRRDGEYTAKYLLRPAMSLDHAYGNFGRACTACGRFYGGPDQDLPFGSAIGDWDGHPWAAKPGIDHRQILVDLEL